MRGPRLDHKHRERYRYLDNYLRAQDGPYKFPSGTQQLINELEHIYESGIAIDESMADVDGLPENGGKDFSANRTEF